MNSGFSFPLRAAAKLFALALLALGAACTTAPSGKGGASPHFKVGNPYQVKGVWYYPEEDPTYSKVGTASWYGRQFHGRLTANGEIFDMNRMSAAHTTLPLPSMVEVTNLENGRSVVVRVNDRGPFADNRIIDMSRQAARELGFEQQGTTKVRVRYRGPARLMAEAPKRNERVREPKRERDRNRVARAAPVTAEPGRAPEVDAISDLLTNMESAPALTPGAEKMVVAEAGEGALARPPAQAEIPAADISTADPDDVRFVRAGVSAEKPAQALYLIRVAALTTLDNLEALRAELGDIGALRLSRIETESGDVFYRVNLGPFSSVETAAKGLEAVRAAGYKDAALVTLTP